MVCLAKLGFSHFFSVQLVVHYSDTWEKSSKVRNYTCQCTRVLVPAMTGNQLWDAIWMRERMCGGVMFFGWYDNDRDWRYWQGGVCDQWTAVEATKRQGDWTGER